MKKLFLAALLIVGTATFAQEQKPEQRPEQRNPTAEQRADYQVIKMTTDLDLNQKQTEQVKALLTARETQRTIEMEARKAEIARMRAKMQEDQASMKAEMKKILTADQYTKWEQKQDEQKGKMTERMNEKKEDHFKEGYVKSKDNHE